LQQVCSTVQVVQFAQAHLVTADQVPDSGQQRPRQCRPAIVGTRTAHHRRQRFRVCIAQPLRIRRWSPLTAMQWQLPTKGWRRQRSTEIRQGSYFPTQEPNVSSFNRKSPPCSPSKQRERPSGSCCNVPRFTLVTGIAVALVVTPLLSLTSSPQAGATAVPAWLGVSAAGPPIAVSQQRPLTSRSTTTTCNPPVQCSYRFGIGATTYPYGAP